MGINRSFNIAIAGIIVLFTGTVFIGCGPKMPPSPEKIMLQEYKGAPDWVVRGCSSYWKADDPNKEICGVGAVGGVKNPEIARESALIRARADIARKIQVTITSLLKDYQATTTGEDHFGTDTVDEQHIEIISKQVSDMNLSGTELVDSWVSDNGTYYVLVALHEEKFKDSINRGDFSEGLKKVIIDRADKAFDDLDKNIENQTK